MGLQVSEIMVCNLAWFYDPEKGVTGSHGEYWSLYFAFFKMRLLSIVRSGIKSGTSSRYHHRLFVNMKIWLL